MSNIPNNLFRYYLSVWVASDLESSFKNLAENYIPQYRQSWNTSIRLGEGNTELKNRSGKKVKVLPPKLKERHNVGFL